MQSSTITLGGGCFWCTEAVFLRVRGVIAVESGYCNGLQARQPSYEDVCRGDTGYNEVVRLQYDPQVISLADLLTIFCSIHDPTSLNRQGNDLGTQYRSGVYFSEPGDEAVIVQTLAALQASFSQALVTEVLPLQHYWPAEPYHQNYFAKNPNQGYCAFVVAPKVGKLQQGFKQWLKQ
ncbi:MAG: peptide-methionine (S)-S-oxide reductase [Betaproteobacteria bacterium]|nr:peptide-methionine (S)-S-oxide reductase [Betaproteobacteria bacterium]